MGRPRSLTEGNIFSSLIRFAVPVLFTLFLQALYGGVDLLVVGQFAQTADVSGVATGSMLLQTVTMVVTGLSMGITILVGERIGRREPEDAGRAIGGGICLFACFAVLLTAVLVGGAEVLARLMHAPEHAFHQTVLYIRICGAGSLFIVAYNVLGSIFRGIGDSRTPLLTVAIACVINIFGDLLLVAGFHMGAAGAALATVLSQMASCAFVLLSLRRKRMPVRLRWGRMELHIVRRVLAFGLSPFLIIATDSILLIVLNTVLQRYGGPELGDTLVTCATIVQSYLLLITMPMGGLTLGSQPVVSFNYGAANLERIKRAIQSIVALCVTFCVLMTVVTHTLSPVFVGLFTQNPEVAARSVRYIKVFTAMIIPLAIQYPLVDETTALGHVRLALFCSIFRKCVFLAGLLLLPALVSPEATFLSEPIADVVAATVTTCLFLHFFPKILAQRAAREREEREEQPKVAP